MGVKRRRNADGDEVHLGYPAEIRCRFEPSVVGECPERSTVNIGYIVLASVDFIDFVIEQIETYGFETCFGYFHRKWKSYISKADNSGCYAFIRDFL